MAVASTLEISFAESFYFVSMSLKSRKIAIDVDYDSSEDTKETRGVDKYFCLLSARSLPTYVAISLRYTITFRYDYDFVDKSRRPNYGAKVDKLRKSQIELR